jgi:toxin ParE1/3/4
MLEIFISPRALQDIEDIWAYTFEKWSIVQADYYQDEISNALQHFASHPTLGKIVESNGIEYLRIKVHHHLLFCRIQKKLLIVVRILHEKMDTDMHL